MVGFVAYKLGYSTGYNDGHLHGFLKGIQDLTEKVIYTNNLLRANSYISPSTTIKLSASSLPIHVSDKNNSNLS